MDNQVKKNKAPMIASIIAAVVLLFVAAGVLIGGPIYSASAWKSAMVEKHNSAVEKMNAVKEVGLDDLSATEKDLDELKSQKKKIEEAISALNGAVEFSDKGVGGLAYFDVTGEYKSAEELNDKLKGTYEDFLTEAKDLLVYIDTNEVAAAYAIDIKNSKQPSTPEEFKEFAKKTRATADKLNQMTKDLKPAHVLKKSSAIVTKLADKIDAFVVALEAKDNEKLQVAMAELTAVQYEANKMDAEQEAELKKIKARMEKIIETLNEQAKDLEK